MGVTGFDSQGDNQSQKSGLKPPHRDSRKAGEKKRAKKCKKGMKDGDFEQMFGKDIDQFLEDSEWDIESMDKVSQYSRGSGQSH